eukprot:g7920.t1
MRHIIVSGSCQRCQISQSERLKWYISKHVEKGKYVYDQEHLYRYTFNYTLWVPTLDYTVTEKIMTNFYEKDATGDFAAKNWFQKNVNECSAGVHKNIKPFVTGDETFEIADKPRLQSLDVSYVSQEYVNPAPTPAPTQKIDCEVTDWTTFTECSLSCGGGSKTRFRMVITDGFGTGKHCKKSCEGEPTGSCVALHESEPCNPGDCPTPCKMKPWGGWSDCSRTCGIGYKTRDRQVDTPASTSPPGKACPTDPVTGETWLKQSIKCTEKQFCPVDCEFSQWGHWSTCSKECGSGKRYRSRFAENQAMFGGEACGAQMPCKDGVTSDLTPPVTKDFGNATHPDVKQMCNAFYQGETCNDNPCPQDCEVSGWSTWGSCSKTCAGKQPGVRLFGAKQERTRYITKPDANGGQPCPGLTQTKLCSLHPCGAHVCTTNKGFPLTCTYENGIVYTHHVNEVHTGELFNCYFNYVTEVCTCLCWPRSVVSTSTHSGASDVSSFMPTP